MTEKESNIAQSQLAFLTFNGNYGGDKYEEWLCDTLSEYGQVRKISADRLGGIRTIKSLFRLISLAYRDRSPFVIRPFGMPVFRKNMIVVFHHFEHYDLPWYSRLIETVDMAGLRLSARVLGTRFLVVSHFWKDWLKERQLDAEFLVFNQVNPNRATASSEVRADLAQKYGLDTSSKWVFLGGDQGKKGGRILLQRWDAIYPSRSPYQFIFSGKPRPGLAGDTRTVWLAPEDYDKFLKQQHVVIANSQFNEGWCRVIHEAILSGVPVAGSGRGGMAELLAMGGYPPRSSESELIEAIRNPATPAPGACERVERDISAHNTRELVKLARHVGFLKDSKYE